MERIAPALQYLGTHFTERVDVEDLARVCHLSVTHFRRLFLKAIRRSPLRYVAQLRIQMASALLENTNRTVLDISHEVGYDSLSSFNRQFRAQTGMSPREWRRR
jgi:AraC-like DNA-binding protein